MEGSVRLEPVSPVYAKESYLLRDDPGLWEFMQCDAPLPATLESEEAFYKECMMTPRHRMFVILYEGKYAGCVKLKNIAHGAAELSYYILRKDLWGKGIATRATKMVISYGFFLLNLDLIYRYVHRDNIGSVNVTLKQKFVKVGASYLNENVDRYEMTKTGWKNELKRLNCPSPNWWTT